MCLKPHSRLLIEGLLVSGFPPASFFLLKDRSVSKKAMRDAMPSVLIDLSRNGGLFVLSLKRHSPAAWNCLRGQESLGIDMVVVAV